MSEAPIFIVGCPRSGTTLLRDLLRSHPRLTFPDESHFIVGLYKAYGDPKTEHEARALASRILNLHWVRAWKLTLQPSDFIEDRSYREVVSRLFGAWANGEHKPRWGDKTPQYVLEIPTLHRLFPDGKILHIIRDGRDVALSWLRSKLECQNLFTAAEKWKQCVAAGRRDGARLPPGSYLEVHYEELITSPEQTMPEVCRFVGEPYTERVLKPNPLPENYRPRFIGHATAGVSESEVVRTNTAKWKTDMARRSQVLFESVAGDLLAELGYETLGLRRQIDKAEELFWNVHHLVMLTADRLMTGRKSEWLPSHVLMRWASVRSRLKELPTL